MNVSKRIPGISHVWGLLSRAQTVYQERGFLPLLRIGYQFTSHWLWVARLTVLYLVRYGKAAPMPNERTQIDPAEIEYGMNKFSYGEVPPFGVLPGSWDQKKVHRFEHGEMWKGLLERYGDGKPWEETSYYQTGIERLRDGETLRVLDAEDHTIEEFEAYMAHLDEMYETMKNDGYDQSSVVPVSIDRDGEWVLYADGNHRTTLAQGAGIESIPVSIVYRHQRWQDIRYEVSRADEYEELSEEAKRHLSHPDLQSLVQSKWQITDKS